MIHLEDLKHFITVYKQQEYRDNIGQVKTELVKYMDFFASRYDWQNRENYSANNLITSDISIFKIHYDSTISTNDVIDFEGRKYHIKGIKELGYREGLEITAQFKSDR
ncbi:phage head closure protein [Litoribacter alkaliphilus]|uniref:Phage head closure protein n=1 Tax=Litoribacter ruber TaxID=702568 RepID=A0AAP2CNR0_9BACT|nr:phage head closure protein [Litoribacter alkaliphilus]MBS9525915.1 phage head closure protein [Litoribacter alkaliphilus]